MKYAFFIYLFVCTLFAQSSSSIVSAASNGSVAVFSVPPSSRGADIVSMFATLNAKPYKLNQSQVAIQTTRNGLIINVTKIAPMTHETILILSYLPPATPTITQYIAVPVEQIVEMVYSTQAISASAAFTSTVLAGVLPVFSVDLTNRAEDIHEVFATLSKKLPYRTATVVVGLQTTLGGSYTYSVTGSPSITQGVIPNIQSISLKGSMLLVNYLVGAISGTVVVTPEQVYGITYQP